MLSQFLTTDIGFATPLAIGSINHMDLASIT